MKQCTGNVRRLRRNVQASVIALLLAWSLPPASPRGAQAQPGTPYAITGTISEATDPAPIVHARIKLLHASDRGLIRDSIFTDESGAFRVNLEVAVGTEESLPIAGAYAADPISPNPISGSTGRAVIRYKVRSNLPERPELELYDRLGRRIPSEGRLASGIYFGRTSVRSTSTNASNRTGETGAFSLPSSGEYVLDVKSSTATFRSDRSDHTGTFDITVE